MYPTETMLPFCTSSWVTSLAAWTVPVPTGWSGKLGSGTEPSKAHLFNEVGSLGEELDQVELEISTLGRSTSVGGGASNDDCATSSA
jgi:hypothetical protein